MILPRSAGAPAWSAQLRPEVAAQRCNRLPCQDLDQAVTDQRLADELGKQQLDRPSLAKTKIG